MINTGKDIRLIAIGKYIAKNLRSNFDVVNDFNLTKEFIENKVGFVSRAIKDNSQKSSDLCYKAFENLCSNVSFDKNDVRVVIVVTQNPDKRIPHTAAIVHNNLGFSSNCMTFDISQGCAGFVHGLLVAMSLLKSFGSGIALLFTSDQYSEIINPNRKNESILFGDAATVSLLSFSDYGYRVERSDFGTVPDSWECIVCDNELVMDGSQVYHCVMDYVVPNIISMISQSEAMSQKIDLFLMHQGSKYIVDGVINSCALDRGKVPFLATKYGNTVSSSIPIMLQNYIVDKSYSKILLSGFGVGFSWGNCVIVR